MKFKLAERGKSKPVHGHLYGYNDNNLWTTFWWALYVLLGLFTLGLVSGILLIHYLWVTQQHFKATRAKRQREFDLNVADAKASGKFEWVRQQFDPGPGPKKDPTDFHRQFVDLNLKHPTFAHGPKQLTEADLLAVERVEEALRKRETERRGGFCDHVPTGACQHCLKSSTLR